MSCYNRRASHKGTSANHSILFSYSTQNSHLQVMHCDWLWVLELYPGMGRLEPSNVMTLPHLQSCLADSLQNLCTLIKEGKWMLGRKYNQQINRKQNKTRTLVYQEEQKNRLSTFIPQLLIECLQSASLSAHIKTSFSFTQLPIKEGCIMKRDPQLLMVISHQD